MKILDMNKTSTQIRERIRDGNARVVTAEEMPAIVAELGEEAALREVDVVTTGTFGAMCSSGDFFNFGHADPPIKMERLWLNDVEAYGGVAAVDAYLGATQKSTTREENYGGAHVIEDFIRGKSIELRALSTGTDCYPRRTLTTELLLENLNQAIRMPAGSLETQSQKHPRPGGVGRDARRACCPTRQMEYRGERLAQI